MQWVGLQRPAFRLHDLLTRNSNIFYSSAALCRRHHQTSRKTSTKAGSLGNAEQSNLNLEHSQFTSEASKKEKWKKTSSEGGKRDKDFRSVNGEDEHKGVEDRRGKIISTSSHLFKLVLPPPNRLTQEKNGSQPPTVFLLHPSQPLSHISRLIASSLTPSTPDISFRSAPPPGHDLDFNNENDEVAEWSDSTNIGDFIKDASRNKQFELVISENHREAATNTTGSASTPLSKSESGSETSEHRSIMVTVPSFHQRTRYLRAKLVSVQSSIQELQSLKTKCDKLAHRGARRTAVGIFFALLSYWGVIARLTFWDYGWDVMEPITYLSGLSTVIMGYVWFLWHNREVSYTSVLSQSISVRREALYRKHGLDIDELMDKVSVVKALRREIRGIAEEYDVKWDEGENGSEHEGRKEDDGDGDGNASGMAESGQEGRDGGSDSSEGRSKGS